MGFMDEVSNGGGTKLLKFDGKAGNYVLPRGGDDDLQRGQEFVVDAYGAGGRLFLKVQGQGTSNQSDIPGWSSPRTRRRARGITRKLRMRANGTRAKFGSGEPEDPWIPA